MRFRQRLFSVVTAGLGTAAILGALGCGDTTAPQRSARSIAGTYDMTVALQMNSFRIEIFTGLQVQFVTDSAPMSATLSGTMVVMDTSGRVFPATVTLNENPPQSAVSGAVAYPGALTVDADTANVVMVANSATGGEAITLTAGTLAGDSIVGKLRWTARGGVLYSIYSGTYIARRRP